MTNNRFLAGIRYAWSGIAFAARHERNIRFHLIVTLLIVVLGWWFGLTVGEWAAIVGMIGLVLSLEMVNSALEYLIDTLRPRFHLQLKVVKDMLAGAVFVAALAAAAVGFLIFMPYALRAVS